jgi:hypothetical protein
MFPFVSIRVWPSLEFLWQLLRNYYYSQLLFGANSQLIVQNDLKYLIDKYQIFNSTLSILSPDSFLLRLVDVHLQRHGQTMVSDSFDKPDFNMIVSVSLIILLVFIINAILLQDSRRICVIMNEIATEVCPLPKLDKLNEIELAKLAIDLAIKLNLEPFIEPEDLCSSIRNSLGASLVGWLVFSIINIYILLAVDVFMVDSTMTKKDTVNDNRLKVLFLLQIYSAKGFYDVKRAALDSYGKFSRIF